MMPASELEVTDLFCGAGGSAQGAVAVPGVSVRIAANHSRLAIESHAANFPDTEHDCADISQVSIEAHVEDATFRMLEPHEIQAAMAFRTDYTVLGNRRERVKQLGNAVTPPAAEFLIRAVVEALEGAA